MVRPSALSWRHPGFLASKREVTPTIGTAIAGTEVYLLDDQRQPVGEGELGELYLGVQA